MLIILILTFIFNTLFIYTAQPAWQRSAPLAVESASVIQPGTRSSDITAAGDVGLPVWQRYQTDRH